MNKKKDGGINILRPGWVLPSLPANIKNNEKYKNSITSPFSHFRGIFQKQSAAKDYTEPHCCVRLCSVVIVDGCAFRHDDWIYENTNFADPYGMFVGEILIAALHRNRSHGPSDTVMRRWIDPSEDNVYRIKNAIKQWFIHPNRA